MHTDAGAITPCSDRNKVLHLLLVTLRHRSAGVDVDPTVIVREHMSDRYLQVPPPTPPWSYLILSLAQPPLPR